MSKLKKEVEEFWELASCGEDLYLPREGAPDYSVQSEARYKLEPYILEFAEFAKFGDKRVLEVGVGLGADHENFARAGAVLTGIDLTERAVEHTRARLNFSGLASDVRVGDAEHLDFERNTFDCVYSWGVLHHSPETALAVKEVHRVLKPGGQAKIMIYHKWSLIGLMLWLRYGLFRLRPFRSLTELYAEHLESPGTKAYSVKEVTQMFSAFKDVTTRIELSHGDLLESGAGQRHQGFSLNVARMIWPRFLIRKFLNRAGLFLLIEARK